MKELRTSVIGDIQTLMESLCKNSMHQLQKGYATLSSHYRDKSVSSSSLHFTQEQIWSYVLARMPATYAVGKDIFGRLRQRLPSFAPRSLLDLGSGSGSMIWSSVETFSSLEQINYWEEHPLFRELMNSVRKAWKSPWPLAFHEIANSLQDASVWTEIKEEDSLFDIVSLSYALGEIPTQDRQALLTNAFGATKGVLLLSEPGTPEGFRLIIEARALLLSLGGQIVAPCTHQKKCPLQEVSQDWCHFPVVVERRFKHQQIKKKQKDPLSWEIEKYTYLIVAKDCFQFPSEQEGRIIKKPMRRQGHLILDLCEAGDLTRTVFSKKNSATYKKALKKHWGDLWQGCCGSSDRYETTEGMNERTIN